MYQMTDTEMKFAELLWQNTPIESGELVKRISAKSRGTVCRESF